MVLTLTLLYTTYDSSSSSNVDASSGDLQQIIVICVVNRGDLSDVTSDSLRRVQSKVDDVPRSYRLIICCSADSHAESHARVPAVISVSDIGNRRRICSFTRSISDTSKRRVRDALQCVLSQCPTGRCKLVV